MKTYHIQPTPGFDSIQLSETEKPVPAYGQVLIDMKAWSLNYRDIMVAENTYGGKRSNPIVPLSDGVGVVSAVGEGVTRFKAGDRVAGIFMQSWVAGPINAAHHNSALGGSIDGVLSEYALLHQDGLVHIPNHLSFEEAATLPCAAVTAWNALFESSKLLPGQTVVLQGTGGVSIFALQFAKAAGAKVIITSSSDQKLAQAKALGADHLINYNTNPDWEKAVWEYTNGEGADNIIEVGGSGTLNRSLKAVRVGGTVSYIGVLSGVAGDIQTALFIGKSIKVQGIYVGSREMFEHMNKAIEANQIKPVIDKVFNFEDARAAFEHLKSASHFGKVVISRP